ncbi:MAG TPA: fibronectin type III domain-containing protein [Verrucomicrobiae bacterium]
MNMLTAKLNSRQRPSGLPDCGTMDRAKKAGGKSALRWWSGLLLLSQVAWAGAANFMPFGAEYAIIGNKKGAQEESSVALGANKGAVVWHDNQVDADGLGIGMQWLDQSVSGSFGSFRVNTTETGNQEKPKVAMLNDGGAVVVWQGGSEVDKDVFIRFMSGEGTFSTGEIKVNTFTELLQIDPDVAVLADGSVIVVWSSFHQDGSYQGVYGQRFTASGGKIGNEFQINQYTPNNQRNATVTALSGGGFVVGWVSEKPTQTVTNPNLTPAEGGQWVQQVISRIEILARRYDAQGLALGNEFQVDAGNTVASLPNACARGDGGFSFVWNQHVAGEDWDIYSRSYNSAGQALSEPFRVNVVNDGKQSSPRAVASGDQLFVVWNSIQTTSFWDDVKGRFIGLASAGSEIEFRVNFEEYSIQNQPALAINKSGQAVVVWTTFVGGENSGDIHAQRYNSVVPLPAGPTPVVSGRDSSSIVVSWSPLVGMGVASYYVYVDGNPSPMVVDANTTQVTINGLQPSTTYSWRIAYRLNDNRVSPQSVAATGRTWGVDSNADGIPDEWQIANWGATASKWGAPGEDSDGDGLSNYQEFLAGTDPRDENSALRTQVQVVEGAFYFKWNTTPGKVYQIQHSSDFQTWTDVGAQRMAVSGEDSVFVDQSAGIGFYRIILVR